TELEQTAAVLVDVRKVVFIGHGGAGKTSLIKSILAGEGRLTDELELESVGVSVKTARLWKTGEGEGVEAKLYDLAGQVDYYGLHQLFLTERALYVLTWDASQFFDQTEVM
ncbi:unnamed protein product, partial [Hapterophycus canaliculatus]